MRNTRIIFVLLLVCACGVAVWKFDTVAHVPSGYVTKVTCSEVFLANREVSDVARTDFRNISSIFEWVSLEVDEAENEVRGHLFGFGRSIAVFDSDHGCRLVHDDGQSPLVPLPRNETQRVFLPFQERTNSQAQEEVLRLFDDGNFEHPIVTRAAVVIQDGEVVAEHYADGFTSNTRLQSWSMSKGILQALVGIAVERDLLSLEQTRLLDEWPETDPRSDISVNHLLQMSSGLSFGEDYSNPFSDVDQMLFNTSDMGRYAASQPLVHDPGSHVQYASGTTNILSLLLKRTLLQRGADYTSFPYTELFWPIGMQSAVFELDASGTFVGSSYVYATTRDFARFGELYLNHGFVDERQILPDDWVAYTVQPASGIDQKYGAHWSINQDGTNLPGMPNDVFYLGGNDGQFIFVIPSKNAVIVRLGVMRYPATFERDLFPQILAIYEAL